MQLINGNAFSPDAQHLGLKSQLRHSSDWRWRSGSLPLHESLRSGIFSARLRCRINSDGESRKSVGVSMILWGIWWWVPVRKDVFKPCGILIVRTKLLAWSRSLERFFPRISLLTQWSAEKLLALFLPFLEILTRTHIDDKIKRVGESQSNFLSSPPLC